MQLHKQTQLRLRTFRYLESLLYDFYQYDKMIAEREEAIFSPYRKEIDENIGGGRSPYQSSVTERIATMLVSDAVLVRLRKEQSAVAEVLADLNDDHLRVVELAYLKKPRTKTWYGIARECGYSQSQCYRIRDRLIKDLAKKLGMQ